MHGVVKDYGGLVSKLYFPLQTTRITYWHLYLAVRVLLGLFESGLYPGIAFYLSWLTKSISILLFVWLTSIQLV